MSMDIWNEISKKANEFSDDFSEAMDHVSDVAQTKLSDFREEAECHLKELKDDTMDVWDNVIQPNLEDIKNSEIVKSAMEKVDKIFQPQTVENIKNAVIEAPQKISAICNDATLDVTVAVSSYYTACEYAVSDAVDAIQDLDIGKTVSDGLTTLYSDSRMVSKICDSCGITPEEVGDKVNELVETTVNVGKATVYVATRAALGATRIVEKAFRGTESIVEYCKGNPEKAKRIIETDNVDAWCEYIDSVFDESELVQEIGDIADMFGEAAVGIALAIVAMKGLMPLLAGSVVAGTVAAETGLAVAGTAATEVGSVATIINAIKSVSAIAFLSVSEMGGKLEENIKKTGNLSGDEIASAAIKGCATAASLVISSVLNVKLLQSIPKIAKYIDPLINPSKFNPANSYMPPNTALGGRILGTIANMAIGGMDSGINSVSDIISDITDDVINIDDNFDAKSAVLKTLSTVVKTATFAGISYCAVSAVKGSAAFNKVMKYFKGEDYTPKPDYFENMFKRARLDLPPIKIECRNESLVNQECPKTGVPYERKIVANNGRRYEVVTPVFDSKFDAKLPPDKYLASDYVQNKICIKQLQESIRTDPEQAAKFDSEQIKQILAGYTPDGYTWNHDVEPGKMQLVDSDIHANTPHTGGKAIWGGGRKYR